APLQMTWFGYVGTTGLSAMDFIIADRFHIRPGEENFYVEKMLRTPGGYACYQPLADAREVGTLPALSSGHVTFGCFNNPSKYSQRTVDAWCEILRRIPTSRLLLKFGGLNQAPVQERVLRNFAARGIDPQRIMLEGWSPLRDNLAAYTRVDLALDTQPYSGGL